MYVCVRFSLCLCEPGDAETPTEARKMRDCLDRGVYGWLSGGVTCGPKTLFFMPRLLACT